MESIFSDTNTLFGQLRATCRDDWNAYCDHEFVRRIANATLPKACFRHYLEQDYLFLIHFSRAWALAVYKATRLADMRRASATLHALLNQEMDLHVKYCASWGLTEPEMEKISEAKANLAYTRYVLERGLAGDLLDLYVALAPCVIGYAEIGATILTHPATILEGNPYREWIEMYSGTEYQATATAEIAQLDALAAVRMGPGRFDDLVQTFRQATCLEIGFWDMGLHLHV